MLLVARLVGFLVRESRHFSWLGPTMRMDKSCCWERDFSALSRGKATFLVGRVCLVPVNTALRPVCGFCVPGFWVRGAASCGARRPGRSGQVLWVVAEQCRT